VELSSQDPDADGDVHSIRRSARAARQAQYRGDQAGLQPGHRAIAELAAAARQ
jgi:hypothetical protein